MRREIYQERRKRGGAVKFIVVIIIILLIWGLLGTKQAEKTGLPCKIRYKTQLCWSWEKTIVEKVENVTYNATEKNNTSFLSFLKSK